MIRQLRKVATLGVLFVLGFVSVQPGEIVHAQSSMEGAANDEGAAIDFQAIQSEITGQPVKEVAEPAPDSIDPQDLQVQLLDLPAPDAGSAPDSMAVPDGSSPDSPQGTGYDSIDPSYDVDLWTFDAVAGQQVVIIMSRTWGSLDSYIELYNPYGRLSAEDDDSGGNQDSRLIGVIGTTGRYTVRAHSFNYASTGGYALSANLSGDCGGCGRSYGQVLAEQMWFTDRNGNRRRSIDFWPGDTVLAHVVVNNTASYSQYATFDLAYEVQIFCVMAPCPSGGWDVAQSGTANVSPGRWEMVMATTSDALRSSVRHFQMRVSAGGTTSVADYRD